MLTIEKLSSRHDRSHFDCGAKELNAYLKQYSGQHERKGIGRTYVAVDEGQSRIFGYYTISSGAVAFDTVPENLPHHPIPVALIGRLAVDNGAGGRGLGETLLIHALRSAQRVSEIMGLYAVVVDALNEKAKNFYMKYGFNELADDQLHLYLPIRTIKQLKL
ncbi:MAG: GNAT family N-acetyltransferase [Pyrinomonadaceae bacterium]